MPLWLTLREIQTMPRRPLWRKILTKLAKASTLFLAMATSPYRTMSLKQTFGSSWLDISTHRMCHCHNCAWCGKC
eukprot:1202990-Amphidinium_carterae.1